MGLKEKLHTFRVKNQDKKWFPVFSGFHTFLFTPNEITHHGTHVKGADDLKRTMNTVVMSLIPCLIFGMFNTGYQHYLALGEIDAVTGGFFWFRFLDLGQFHPWILENITLSGGLLCCGTNCGIHFLRHQGA